MIGEQEYYDTVGDKPNSLVIQAVQETPGRQEALDLGAGNLRDSKYMLSQGFIHVTAVDNNPEFRRFAVDGIEVYVAEIEVGDITPNFFDLIVCCNTLFYIQLLSAKRIFADALNGLRPQGVFACNVLGTEDDWVLLGNQSSFTQQDILMLCQGFEVVALEEIRYTAEHKNWHLWSFIVRKP